MREDKAFLQIIGDTISDFVSKDDFKSIDVKKLSIAEKKDMLYAIQSGYCNGCSVFFSKRNLTIDHIKPRSKGGNDTIGNLQLLCHACNSLKGNRTQAYLEKELRKQGVI